MLNKISEPPEPPVELFIVQLVQGSNIFLRKLMACLEV